MFVNGSASEMPLPARAARILLQVAAGLTAMVALQAWIIVGGVYGFGVAMVFAVPAVACAVAAWRMSRPGQWLWWAVLVLELFYLLWQLGRLPGGDPFALVGLAFPIAILVLIARPRTREWLAPVGWRELPGELRAGAIALRVRARRDRGEGTVGYLGVVLAIATVAVVLTTSSIPAAVAGSVESAVCRVTGASCDPPRSAGPAARPLPSAAGRPSGPVPQGSAPEGPGLEVPLPDVLVRQPEQVLEPAPSGAANTPVPRWTQKEQHFMSAPRDGQTIIPAEDYDAPLSCWEVLQGTCDLGQGIWIGGVDALYGARDAANMLTCSAYIGCGPERFAETWDGWRRLVTTNPADTVTAAWDAATKDMVNDWTRGQPWRAVGRAAPAVLSTIFGGKGLNRVKDLPGAVPEGKIPNEVPVAPERPGLDQNGPIEQWQAGKGPDDATDPHLGNTIPVGPPAAWKEVANGAAVHRSVQSWMSTPTGRSALEVIGKYGVNVRYREGGGTLYGHGRKPGERGTIWIDVLRGDGSHKDLDEMARSMTHEAEHARYAAEGLSAHGNVWAHSRDEFIKLTLEEEVAAVAKEIELTLEMRARKPDVPVTYAENSYSKGRDHRIRQEELKARREGRTLSEEERRQFGMEGGELQLRNDFYSGKFLASGNGKKYPDLYGEFWDKSHGIP